MSDGLRSAAAAANSDLEHECKAYCDHINQALVDYPELSLQKEPLDSASLFARLRDGVIIGYLLHHFFPGSIQLDALARSLDLGQMNQPQSRATFQVNQNLNLIIERAKSIKQLVVVNIGALDILEMRKDLVLGLLWQLFRGHLLSRINLASHPELIRLLQASETLADLVALRPETLLLRWVNFHLERAGSDRRLSGFGRELKDSECFAILMRSIAPKLVAAETVEAIQAEAADGAGLLRRAEMLLELAESLGCRQWVCAQDIVEAHPRLNLAFAATLFNHHVGIHLPSEEDARALLSETEMLQRELASTRAELCQRVLTDEQVIQCAQQELVRALEQQQADRERHEQELEGLRSELDHYKEELQAEFEQSLQSNMEQERKLAAERIEEASRQVRDARKGLMRLAGFLHNELGREAVRESKLDGVLVQMDDDMDTETLSRLVGDLCLLLGKQLRDLRRGNEELRSTIAHKEHVNEVFGAKIKEYTENLITAKKTGLHRVLSFGRK